MIKNVTKPIHEKKRRKKIVTKRKNCKTNLFSDKNNCDKKYCIKIVTRKNQEKNGKGKQNCDEKFKL